MARRTFFSFHYDRDVFRANQVRNCNVVVGTDIAGFFDHSEYETAKKLGDAGIRRMIDRHLENTTVTVVLIGNQTSSRPWVQYEIKESIARKNGLLGIQIHHLKHGQQTDLPGATPVVPYGVDFPVYQWDADVKRFAREIEAAGLRSERLRM